MYLYIQLSTGERSVVEMVPLVGEVPGHPRTTWVEWPSLW
jgi:hypothetical protein